MTKGKKDNNITTQERKKNQYESIFKNPEAISLAPICKGISRLLNVPLNPAVNTKNTIIVPCMVTNARYTLGSITPSVAHLPSNTSKIQKDSSGQAN